MNAIKTELEKAGFTVRTGNGALVALLGKRPNRTDVEVDRIGGELMLTIRRNGDEQEPMMLADEAAVMAALVTAGILTASKAAPRFTAELNRRAWAIRREAAVRFGVKVSSISWAECLKLARS